MADEHNARMFRWRNQLLADPHLTDFDFRVAHALAERTLRDTGCAKVRQGDLVRGIGATRRGIQKSLHRIAKHGHMRIEDNSKRGAFNRYWPVIRDDGADGMEGQPVHSHSSESPELPLGAGEQPGGCEQPFAGGASHRSQGVRTAVRRGCEPPFAPKDPYRDPETSPERESPLAADVKSAFEEWWGQYPKRVSKGAARKAYHRIVRSKQATVEQLKLGAMRYAASVANHDAKYVKHPATWLNQECWLDEPDKQPTTSDARPAAGGGNGWAGMYRKFG